jgi:hypothetical protein
MEIVINRMAQDESGVDAKLFGQIIDTFEWAFGKIPDQTTGRLIVEMQADGTSDPHSVLDIAPAAGVGSNCAEGKIATLRKYPNINNTGEVAGIPSEARDAEDIQWYGGIQIRYTDTNLNDGKGVQGVVRIAFSGADQWHDTFIAVAVLRTAIKTVAELCPGYHFSYDYGKLKENPVSGFFCNLLGV